MAATLHKTTATVPAGLGWMLFNCSADEAACAEQACCMETASIKARLTLTHTRCSHVQMRESQQREHKFTLPSAAAADGEADGLHSLPYPPTPPSRVAAFAHAGMLQLPTAQ